MIPFDELEKRFFASTPAAWRRIDCDRVGCGRPSCNPAIQVAELYEGIPVRHLVCSADTALTITVRQPREHEPVQAYVDQVTRLRARRGKFELIIADITYNGVVIECVPLMFADSSKRTILPAAEAGDGWLVRHSYRAQIARIAHESQPYHEQGPDGYLDLAGKYGVQVDGAEVGSAS